MGWGGVAGTETVLKNEARYAARTLGSLCLKQQQQRGGGERDIDFWREGRKEKPDELSTRYCPLLSRKSDNERTGAAKSNTN